MTDVSSVIRNWPAASVSSTTIAPPARPVALSVVPMLPSGCRKLVEECDEETPEALHRRDREALGGRVRELDLRAEREHVELLLHSAIDHRALEPGVHRRRDRRLAEEALVDALCGRERGR